MILMNRFYFLFTRSVYLIRVKESVPLDKSLILISFWIPNVTFINIATHKFY